MPFSGCALASGAARVMPVPPAPAVPTDAIVADSPSTVIAWPAEKPDTLPTLMFVSPAAAAAARPVGPPRTVTALLFSSSMFAAETPPTEQPAAVYVSHGAG